LLVFARTSPRGKPSWRRSIGASSAIRILAALSRIDAHRGELDRLLQRIAQLGADRDRLDAVLQRIAVLKQAVQLLAHVEQVLRRREMEASTEATSRQAMDEAIRVRDVVLPALIERQTAIEALCDLTSRLEAIEAGITALQEGETELAEADGQKQRAADLGKKGEQVGARLLLAERLRDAIRRLDSLDERTQALTRLRQSADEVSDEVSALEVRDRGLSEQRARLHSVEAAATELGTAEEDLSQANQRLAAARGWQQASATLAAAEQQRKRAAAAAVAVAEELGAAERRLDGARAARTQAVGPLLRGWITARTAADRVDQARADEPIAAAEHASAERSEQACASRLVSNQTRATALLGGGVVGLIVGVVVALAVTPIIGGGLAIVGVIAIALAARAFSARSAQWAALQAAQVARAATQERLAAVHAIIQTAPSGEDLAEAERALLEVGHPLPESVQIAEQQLAAARERDADALQAEAREREAQAEVARLNQEHGRAETSARESERLVAEADQARQAAHERLDTSAADPESAVAQAATNLAEATSRRERAIRLAAGFAERPTAEALRLLAARIGSAVAEAEEQLRSLPEKRLRLDGVRADIATTEQTLAQDGSALKGRLAVIELNPGTEELTGIRAVLSRAAEGLDEASLRTEQARLNTDQGSALYAAATHGRQATAAWQRAQAHGQAIAAQSLDGSLWRLGTQLADAAAAGARGEPRNRDILAQEATAERERLARTANELCVALDVVKLRQVLATMDAERERNQDHVGRLSALTGEHDRAQQALTNTDAEIDQSWRDITVMLGSLGFETESRTPTAARERLQSEVLSLDEATTRTAHQAAIAAIGEAENMIRERQKDIVHEQGLIDLQLGTVGLNARGFAHEELAAILPELNEPGTADEQALCTARDECSADIRHLGMRQQELETALDLVSIPLDLEQEHAELARLCRVRDIKRRGGGHHWQGPRLDARTSVARHGELYAADAATAHRRAVLRRQARRELPPQRVGRNRWQVYG
jgi:hypothetical protein